MGHRFMPCSWPDLGFTYKCDSRSIFPIRICQYIYICIMKIGFLRFFVITVRLNKIPIFYIHSYNIRYVRKNMTNILPIQSADKS